jgi:hypothetical protein
MKDFDHSQRNTFKACSINQEEFMHCIQSIFGFITQSNSVSEVVEKVEKKIKNDKSLARMITLMAIQSLMNMRPENEMEENDDAKDTLLN